MSTIKAGPAAEGRAIISDDGAYRYALTRRWDACLPVLPFMMLNPSTADARISDPTVGRCCAFARRDGYGGICVLNEYGLRSPHPSVLRAHPDPVGPENDKWIAGVASAVRDLPWRVPFVLAWGAHPLAAARVPRVMELLAGIDIVCLGVTRSGAPKHPLARGRERIPDDAPLIPWRMPS